MIHFLIGLLLLPTIALAKNPACENLFLTVLEANQEESSQAKIEKLEKKFDADFSKAFKIILQDEHLSPQAKVLGSELIQLSYFWGELASSLQGAEKFTPEQVLVLGDLLMNKAEAFATAANLNIKFYNRQIFNHKRRFLIIDITGTNPLNVEASEIIKNDYLELAYDPYELIKNMAGAMHDTTARKNRIYINEDILVNGTIMNNHQGAHELVHAETEFKNRRDLPYVFFGSAKSKHGKIPGINDVNYSKELYFDEVDAYFSSVQGSINMLEHIEVRNFSKSDKKIIEAQILSGLETNIGAARNVATKVYTALNDSLRLLKNNESHIRFKNVSGRLTAFWRAKESHYYYDIELPIFTSGDSRENYLDATFKQIKQTLLATIYYRNLFSLGKIFKIKYKSAITKDEKIKLIQIFKKFLVRKYFFESKKEIPTQKEFEEQFEAMLRS